MSVPFGFELSISITRPSLFTVNDNTTFFTFSPKTLIIPCISSAFLTPLSKPRRRRTRFHSSASQTASGPQASNVATEEDDEEVAEGVTMTQLCDKIIDLFMNQKPRTKDWKKYLLFRESWNKYRGNFYRRCQSLADAESDTTKKEKLSSLWQKVKKVDEEMEKNHELLSEIEENPTDLNVVVAKRRKDFTGQFFRYLALLSESRDSLEERDAVSRLGTRCLSAISAYDNTLETVETLDTAQAKFENILNSPTLEAACQKIRSLAKAKELESSLILLINSAWASAKESTTMRNEVKEIMYQIYKTTKSSLRSMSPKEIKLLKHLLNIVDPEERFSALATAFSPEDEPEKRDAKDEYLYTTPEELHKWITIMLDAYHFHKDETDIREARKMTTPIVIQRLFILKETIEQEYMAQKKPEGSPTDDDPKPFEL